MIALLPDTRDLSRNNGALNITAVCLGIAIAQGRAVHAIARLYHRTLRVV
jgi:hypothetical protein